MKRRDLLGWLGAVGAAGLAGCLGSAGGGDGGDGNDGGDADDDSTPAATPTASPTATPGVADASFEVLSQSSGTETNDAEVVARDPPTVEGTITGNNGCYTAELAAATASDGTLTVRVRSYEDRPEDAMCTQALVEIRYRATVSLVGPAPDRVVVEHERDGETKTVLDEQL